MVEFSLETLIYAACIGVSVRTGTFVWLEVAVFTREGLKCASTVCGVRSVMTVGATMTL